MEKQQDYTLLKARSYRSVLMTGFSLYTEYFRRLFKASWLMALLYAAACGCLGTLLAIKIPEMTTTLMQQFIAYQGFFLQTLQQYALTILGIIGLTLLAIVTMSLASATILNMLKEHHDTGVIPTPLHWFSGSPRLMGRTLKGVGLTLLIILVPMVLFIVLIAVADAVSPQFTMRHLTTVIVTFLVCIVIVMLLSLPLMHVLMKYLMKAPCGYWRTLCQNYGRGMRHWGALFLVFFLSTMIVQIVALVVMLPAHILQFANQTAQAGLLMGDPLGMPSYMTTLTFCTFMLTSYIQFYICQVTLIHNYYIYGSIETKEYEKDTVH